MLDTNPINGSQNQQGGSPPMSHMRIVSNNHRPKTFRPKLVKTTKINEQEDIYYAALELVARIDEELTLGIKHYRSKSGRLLTTLDEVVNAILDDTLAVAEAQQPELRWVVPQELAA